MTFGVAVDLNTEEKFHNNDGTTVHGSIKTAGTPLGKAEVVCTGQIHRKTVPVTRKGLKVIFAGGVW